MFCAIMTGGAGTRLWPASTPQRPKPFLDLGGQGPLLSATVERVLPIARKEEIVAVTTRALLDETRRCLAGRQIELLAEPCGRGTAACAGLAAVAAGRRGIDDPIAIMPADHFVRDAGAFCVCLTEASAAAREGGIAVLGIIPTRPETGFGYIRAAAEAGGGARRAEAFIEKPSEARARELIDSGCLWNGGIFVEKTKATILVVPCDAGWSDIGSWRAVAEIRQDERDPQKKPTACVGLRRCAPVDTGDALLVADLDRPEEVRRFAEAMDAEKAGGSE